MSLISQPAHASPGRTVKITKDMSVDDVLDKLREVVGNRKICKLIVLDHGSIDLGKGQQLGNRENYLNVHHFEKISDLMTRKGLIDLHGCGMGSTLYDTYRKKIAQVTQCYVRGAKDACQIYPRWDGKLINWEDRSQSNSYIATPPP